MTMLVGDNRLGNAELLSFDLCRACADDFDRFIWVDVKVREKTNYKEILERIKKNGT